MSLRGAQRRSNLVNAKRPKVSLMPFDLVIFDCDGVLIVSEPLSIRVDLECLAEIGIAVSADEILERYTGVSWAEALADLEARHGPLPADLDARRRARRRALFEAELKVIPGVPAVLDSVIGKICVASSGRSERLRHALGLVGLYDRFHP